MIQARPSIIFIRVSTSIRACKIAFRSLKGIASRCWLKVALLAICPGWKLAAPAR